MAGRPGSGRAHLGDSLAGSHPTPATFAGDFCGHHRRAGGAPGSHGGERDHRDDAPRDHPDPPADQSAVGFQQPYRVAGVFRVPVRPRGDGDPAGTAHCLSLHQTVRKKHPVAGLFSRRGRRGARALRALRYRAGRRHHVSDYPERLGGRGLLPGADREAPGRVPDADQLPRDLHRVGHLSYRDGSEPGDRGIREAVRGCGSDLGTLAPGFHRTRVAHPDPGAVCSFTGWSGPPSRTPSRLGPMRARRLPSSGRRGPPRSSCSW